MNVKHALIKNTALENHAGPALAMYGEYSRGQTLTIEGSAFSSWLKTGPAGLLQSSMMGTTVLLNISSSYFEANEGAIHADVNYSDASIVNSIFVNNTNAGATSAVILNGGAQEQKAILNSLFLEEAAGDDQVTKVAAQFNSTTRNKIYNSAFLGLAGIQASQVFEIHHSFIDKQRIDGSAFKKNLIYDGRDAKFSDVSAYNFELLDGSDLIDNGSTDEIGLPETDFQGNPRMVGDYVDIGPFESSTPNGGDLNDGGQVIDGPVTVSTLTELRTALAAVIANGQDDTILMEDGIYRVTEDGQGPLEYFDNESFQITLKSVNPLGAILDGGSEERVLEVNSTSATSLLLDGVVIQNGFAESGAAGLHLNVKSTSILNSSFVDNMGSAIESYGDYGRGEEILIEGSNFLRNRAKPAIVHEGYYSPLMILSSYFEDNEGAVQAHVNYSDATIQNSIFVNNTGQSEFVGVSLGGGAQESKTVQNSLFLESGSTDSEESKVALRFASETKNRLYNSVFLESAGVQNQSELIEIYYSFIDENRIEGSAFRQGLLFAGVDPGIENVDARDFRLKPDSALIDMGFDGDLAVADTDYAGNSRLVGEFIDIGPFEAEIATGGNRPVLPEPADGAVIVSSIAELRAALKEAAANGQDDEILLNDGVYDLSSDGLGGLEFFDNEDQTLTLSAINSGQATLDGAGQFLILEAGSLADTGLFIEGLVFKNGYADSGPAGLKLNMRNTIVSDSRFEGNRGSAISSYGDYGRNETIKIQRSQFFNNSAAPAIDHSGYYSPLEVISSRFENNEGAVHALVNYSPAIIQNSIFLNNTSGDQSVGVHMRGGNRSLHNSLFSESYESQTSDRIAHNMNGRDVNQIYNSIYLNDANVTGIGEKFEIHHSFIDTANLDAPVDSVRENLIFDGIALGFVDEAAGNYDLQVYSELINAGSPEAIGLPEEDIVGNRRIAGGVVDIGPYESRDLDDDGIVDGVDSDRDGDGIPNTDELALGLDPWVADGHEDRDGDGMSNYREWRFGTGSRRSI